MTPAKAAPMRENVTQAFPQQIGRVHLGEHPSDGERLCSHSHPVPAGHPLYWPERLGEYPDDVDPLCLEHAIEQTVSDNGYCDCLAHTARPDAGDEDVEPFGYWVTQKHADPILLRKPAYIPEPSDLRTVTPLYTAAMREGLDRGMVEVPREPTKDMLLAGSGWNIMKDDLKRAWTAMLKAAEQPR